MEANEDEERQVQIITEYGNAYEIRAFPGGNDRYDSFIKNKIVGIGWRDLGDVSKLDTEQIKQKITTTYIDKNDRPIFNNQHIGQIAGFFNTLIKIKENDLIFIPYIKEGVPIVTVCLVTGPYHYNAAEPYYGDDTTQQLNIEVINEVNREELKENYRTLNSSLNARLALTKLDTKKHKDGIDFCLTVSENDVYANFNSKISNSNNNGTLFLMSKAPEINTFNSKTPKNGNANYSTVAATVDESYKNTLKEITDLIKKCKNEVVIKSLLMSALSAREYYIKERLRLKLNTYLKPNGDNLVEIINEFVLNDLDYKDTRKKLGKLTFPDVDFSSSYDKLRNCLAHGSKTVEIDMNNNKVNYSTKTNKKNRSGQESNSPDIFKLLTNLSKVVDSIQASENKENG